MLVVVVSQMMKCDCGHVEDHHNPGEPYEGIQDSFSGNCRNCKCLMFTTEQQSGMPMTSHGLIARHRGEVIVRRWNDEMEALRAEHANDVAQFNVLLEESRRLQRISNKKIVELENKIKALQKR